MLGLREAKSIGVWRWSFFLVNHENSYKLTACLHDCDVYQVTICFPLFLVLRQPGEPEECHTSHLAGGRGEERGEGRLGGVHLPYAPSSVSEDIIWLFLLHPLMWYIFNGLHTVGTMSNTCTKSHCQNGVGLFANINIFILIFVCDHHMYTFLLSVRGRH